MSKNSKDCKVICKECGVSGSPAFDGKCAECGCAFPTEGAGMTMTKEELRSILPLPGENEPDTSADALSFLSDIRQEAVVNPYCGFCGISVTEEATICSRCSMPIKEAQEDDENDEDEEDDTKGDGGEEDDGDDEEDDEEENAKKKVLLDRTKRKGSMRENYHILTPIEEAAFYIDLSRGLSEGQVGDIAAHIAWGDQNKFDEDITPHWLPDEYRIDWAKLAEAGKPRTMLGAVSALRGVISSRGGN